MRNQGPTVKNRLQPKSQMAVMEVKTISVVKTWVAVRYEAQTPELNFICLSSCLGHPVGVTFAPPSPLCKHCSSVCLKNECMQLSFIHYTQSDVLSSLFFFNILRSWIWRALLWVKPDSSWSRSLNQRRRKRYQPKNLKLTLLRLRRRYLSTLGRGGSLDLVISPRCWILFPFCLIRALPVLPPPPSRIT